ILAWCESPSLLVHVRARPRWIRDCRCFAAGPSSLGGGGRMTNATPMGRVVIAGGTGFLGQNLARHLTARGWEVVVMSRHGSNGDARWQHAIWDARTVGDWAQQLDGAAALVNL